MFVPKKKARKIIKKLQEERREELHKRLMKAREEEDWD